MDKFGIFNLLNSLFNANTKSAPEEDKINIQNNTTLNTPKSEEFKQDNQKTIKINANKNISGKPLQSYMLNTMSFHDEIIKRVNARCNKDNK